MTVRHDGLTVDWLGYATLRLEGEESVVYVDPGRYGVLTGEWEPDTDGIGHPPSRDYRAGDGDVVCVTHVHHYDPDGIERVAADDATVVAFEGIDGQAADRDLPPLDELPYEIRRVGTKESLETDAGVRVWSVPAYNERDGPNTRPDGTPYHPEGFGCGFVLDVEGTRVLYPGDTDVPAGPPLHRHLAVLPAHRSALHDGPPRGRLAGRHHRPEPGPAHPLQHLLDPGDRFASLRRRRRRGRRARRLDEH